jgi:aminocarboxymuconate-semialdehyde decarboxylase
MDKLGIERQVLSISYPNIYCEDDGLNLYLSQLTNDFLVAICYKYPDRFSGFINLPLANMKNAVDELHHFINAPGILGIIVGTHVNGKSLASEEFNPLFQEIDRVGLPIMIHPLLPMGIEKYQDYRDFYRSVGFLWETTMAMGSLALYGILERYRNIKWILSHLGGTLPFVYTSMDMCQKRNPGKERMPPQMLSEYFRTVYADCARLITAPVLSCALDLYGNDHIVFGSDIPFAPDVVAINTARLEEINLSDEVKQGIYYNNVKKLLKI